MDKAKRIAAYMLAVCVAFGTFPLNALGGDGYSSRIPFKISDPKNVTDKDTVFTVKLSSVGKAPMPEVASINAKANEEYMFGPIEFEEPGDYSYTISQVAVNDDRIILDETIYEVDVAVFVEADGSMWGSTAVRLEGSGSKEEIPVFENDYGKITPPEDSSRPQSSSSDESSDTDSSDGSDTDSGDSSDTSDSSRKDDSDSSEDDSSQDEDSSSSKVDSGGYVDTSSSEADVIPPADDSSDAESSDTDISGGVGTSSGTDSSGTKTQESSNGGGGVGTLIDTLTSPDTGGKVAVTFSGLMIAGAVVAVASGRRRSRRNSDNDDDDGGGSG